MKGIAVAAFALLASVAAAAPPKLLDDFSDVAAWKASASDQVHAGLRRNRDGSLCLHYDFNGVSGYAVMRRALPLVLPPEYEFVARIKGGGATNDLQFKLIDASGDNVWWVNRPNHALPRTPTDWRIKRRHIGFAWGPTPDRVLRESAALEFVISAGRDGGKGSLCLARLELRERDPAPATPPPPVVKASAGRVRADVLFGAGADDAWRMPKGRHTLDIDFGYLREFNGLAVHWPQNRVGAYDVLASEDGRRWRTLRRVRGQGPLDALFLPESEARRLRLRLDCARAAGCALAKIELPTHTQWPTPNAVLATLAAAAPRGDLPRAFLGEQNYWTLVGVDGGGDRSALISEDGAIEVGRGGYSVEPSVQIDDGRAVTWADVAISHTLRDGYLPIPAVRWRHPRFALDIEAAADGVRATPNLLARYTLTNLGDEPLPLALRLAVRPWQVNPPQQFLTTPGGVRPIRSLRWTGGVLRIDGSATLRPLQAPQRIGALPFDAGVTLDALAHAPALTALTDPQAFASAQLTFRVVLPPRGTRTLGWVAPLAPGSDLAQPFADQLDARFDAVASHWRARLNRTSLRLPAPAQRIADTVRTSLAHMLMSRDGRALRPGTRSYARTWIRDGAMMVAGLVRLGEIDAAREFIDWYAGHVYASGKVPCCVDARGADPVAENDSHGQYLYAVAEVWRHTRDAAWLAHHWPHVASVTAYMERLRQGERTDANRRGDRAAFFGLMPPSISHEGYSDKPAYSYWDDFWALRGYKDAVIIARALGHPAAAEKWSHWRDEFARELVASIGAAAARHRIDFIAGAADRGDFDAASTTIALNPAQAQDVLPPQRLADTFERYWQESEARAKGTRPWSDYTPYELRTVGALVRLGEPGRAHAMLRFFFNDQRPSGWNQWAEVVAPDPRFARFLGDMPHAWVSSDYIRSALDLFAYERESDDSLVLAAGVPREWLDEGVEVRGLSTAFGSLGYRLARDGRDWRLDVAGGLVDPKGGLRLIWAGTDALPVASAGGQALAWHGRELRLPVAPATIFLRAP